MYESQTLSGYNVAHKPQGVHMPAFLIDVSPDGAARIAALPQAPEELMADAIPAASLEEALAMVGEAASPQGQEGQQQPQEGAQAPAQPEPDGDEAIGGQTPMQHGFERAKKGR